MTAPEFGRLIPGAGGVGIATYHLGGDGPPVMLLHGTGFHGRCWLPMVPALTDRFSVWSIDLRGHGASGKAADGKYDDWSLFVVDLLAVVGSLGVDGWRGFGHSLGGAILLLAEQRQPGTFVELCLYEPVAIPPGHFGSGTAAMTELARRRRQSFTSRPDARENFAAKPPMDRFDAAALDAYVTYGLVDDPAGGVKLACAREDEASVYEGAPRSRVWEALVDVRPPVAVLGGVDRGDHVGRTVEDMARRLPRGGARRCPGLTHFGPFEDPLGVGRVAATAMGTGRPPRPGDESATIVAPPR
jgi:pimeloyl-ACP methyl ester carboxylesterase